MFTPPSSRSHLKQVGAALSAGLLTALLITPSLSLAAPLFGVFVGSGNNNGCGNSTGIINNSPIPVSDELTCSTQIGTGAGRASATFGSVGAQARVTTVTGVSIPFVMGAAASFADTLTFSKTNPDAPNQFPVSLNLVFGGIVNAGAGIDGIASAQADIIVSFLSASVLSVQFGSDGSSIVRGSTFGSPPDFAVTGTIAPGASGFNTRLTTPQRLASVGDVSFSLQINTLSQSIGSNGSATTDFLNTLEFPSGIDVFNLPAGYTVNAGSYLVNNRFIDPNPQPPPPNGIPEPSTLALLGLGLLGAAGFRRRSP